MKELNERDMRILTKGFLNALNDVVNGDENRCIDSVQAFNMADLGAFGSVVVPHIVQELIHQGLAKECETRGQVRITRRGKDRLNRTIESNIGLVLETLTKIPRNESGKASVHGTRLQELTELTPAEINDAVEALEGGGLVSTFKALGTNPFTFYHVEITPRGRYEYVRQSQHQRPPERSGVRQSSEGRGEISLRPTPAGSPYGFNYTDWERVIDRTNDRDKLYVVFGYKFESKYYENEVLAENVRKMFEEAIKVHKEKS